MKVELAPDRPRFEVPLREGGVLTLGFMTFEDRDLITLGLEEMSEGSRFDRFGQGIAKLSERELDYLASADQQNHVAIGAMIGDEGVGVGRYFVSPDDGCAEAAVTVTDNFQRRGIGTILLQALGALAGHQEVETLCFFYLPGNAGVETVLDRLSATAVLEDGVMRGRIEVSEMPAWPYSEDATSALQRFRELEMANGSDSATNED